MYNIQHTYQSREPHTMCIKKLLKGYGPEQIPQKLFIKNNVFNMVHTYTTSINYIYLSSNLNLKANLCSYISIDATHFYKKK